jgi:elongation factor Ts
MAAVHATDVKNLRERTGAGMMDCKKALDETNGDMEAAVDLLRAKGLATAAKKSSRTAAEGLVGVAVDGTKGVAVEVNFRNRLRRQERPVPGFRAQDHRSCAWRRRMMSKRSRLRPIPAAARLPKLTNNVATIGENQQIRRMKTVSVSQRRVVCLCHNAAAPNLGKIGVLVALESEAGADVLEPLGKQIAMHIAAAFPQALDRRARSRTRSNAKRKIAREKAAESGKPADIVEKMVDGAVPKFAKENALLSQLFVIDNKTPIAQVVAQAGKAAGTKIVLKDYVRFQLGEGIEKEVSDFAAEVAAAVGLILSVKIGPPRQRCAGDKALAIWRAK